jgi:hypothetical protein
MTCARARRVPAGQDNHADNSPIATATSVFIGSLSLGLKHSPQLRLRWLCMLFRCHASSLLPSMAIRNPPAAIPPVGSTPVPRPCPAWSGTARSRGTSSRGSSLSFAVTIWSLLVLRRSRQLPPWPRRMTASTSDSGTRIARAPVGRTTWRRPVRISERTVAGRRASRSATWSTVRSRSTCHHPFRCNSCCRRCDLTQQGMNLSIPSYSCPELRPRLGLTGALLL